MSDTHTNGDAHGDAAPATITLTMTVSPWHLDIKATVENFDQAVAMLDQAKRYFETQLRALAALQMQEHLRAQERGRAIAERVMGRA